jgi:hypothetical protein
MVTDELQPWSVTARNLPEHAGNAIHTDEGARAAGYPAALVAGVTVYAYLTHVPATAWGLDWVRSGGAEVRFSSPIMAADRVECLPRPGSEGWCVDAHARDAVHATIAVWEGSPPPSERERPLHVPLARQKVTLEGRWAAYGERAGDELALYAEEQIVHPAVWPALGNEMMSTHFTRGSWIHTRSRIVHLGVGPLGATAVVHPVLVDQFDTRAGRRVVLDIEVTVDRAPVARLEHEALVELA